MNLKEMSSEDLLKVIAIELIDDYVIERQAHIPYFKELLSRLERLEQRDEVWRAKKELLENADAKKAIEINNLKCCGNCGSMSDCPYMGSECDAMNYCNQWQSDNLNREERRKK